MDKYGNNAHILGRYCSVMRLKAYQVFGFDDSNELNAKNIDYLLKRKKRYMILTAKQLHDNLWSVEKLRKEEVNLDTYE